MTSRIGIMAVCLCLVVCSVPVRASQGTPNDVTTSGGAWKAGVATVVITPEQPMWMAGYAARNRPSEGKVHDLHGKALAMEDARGARLVIVTADLIGFPRELRDQLEKEVAERYKLSRESLLLNASHTHSGPELRAWRTTQAWDLPDGQIELCKQYNETLRGKLVELVGRALADLSPAQLSYLHARAGFAMNRRSPTSSGYTIAPNPDGPVDHDVPVLRVDSPDGKLRALLCGYACHNTTSISSAAITRALPRSTSSRRTRGQRRYS
jgi:neutral ceramidase